MISLDIQPVTFANNNNNTYFDQYTKLNQQLHAEIIAVVEDKLNSFVEGVKCTLSDLTGRVVKLEKAIETLSEAKTHQTTYNMSQLTEEEQNVLKIHLPAKSYEDIQNLDEKFGSDHEFKAIVFKKYKIKLNQTGRSRAIQVIDDFITRNLCTELSWTGSRNKQTSPVKPALKKFEHFIATFNEICMECDENFENGKTQQFFISIL